MLGFGFLKHLLIQRKTKMINKKNIGYYVIAILLFIVSKFAYSYAKNDMVTFLTKPTSKIISFITNSTAIYNPESGFYYENLNIVIDKSCSGFNFFILLYLLLFFSTIKIIQQEFYKIITIPTMLLLAYLITLFVNTSRILISIFIENKTALKYEWLHQAEGVFIYLSFLIIFYKLSEYLQTKIIKHHAKLT